MTRAAFTQFSFRGGEWSPFAQGRADLDAYQTALNLCLNYVPLDEGALTRRSGTQFVATAKQNTGVRLVPLTGSDGTSYVLEFTDSWVRFFTAGAQKTDVAFSVTSISAATPAKVLTGSAHGYSTGDTVIFFPSAGTPAQLAPLINQQFIITVTSATEFTLVYTGARSGNVVGTDITWTSGTVAQVEEDAMPFSAAQLPEIKWTQNEDKLYLFHKSHQTRAINTLLNSTTGLFDVSTVAFVDGPYFDLNTTTTTITPSATTGSVTLTASSITGINGGIGFQTTDIDRHIRLQDSAGNWVWAKITAFTNTTHVTGTIYSPGGTTSGTLANTTAITNWRMGLYSDTTGWPTVGEFHEGRLCIAGEVETNRIDGSNTFGSENFSPTAADGSVADSNAFTFKFAFSGRNAIKWLHSDESGLLAGTESAELFVRASNLDDPLTPFSVQARKVSEYGSKDALACMAGGTIMFIQVLGKIVREMIYSNGGYTAKNISISGRHLLTEGVEELVYAQTPVSTIWARRTDQRLIGCSYRRDEDGEQIGWHQHNVNYSEDPDNTSTGPVLSIAVLPQSDNSSSLTDTLWMANNRNSVTCIEYMRPLFESGDDDTNQFFVDSGVRYTATSFGKNWSVA